MCCSAFGKLYIVLMFFCTSIVLYYRLSPRGAFSLAVRGKHLHGTISPVVRGECSMEVFVYILGYRADNIFYVSVEHFPCFPLWLYGGSVPWRRRRGQDDGWIDYVHTS